MVILFFNMIPSLFIVSQRLRRTLGDLFVPSYIEVLHKQKSHKMTTY